MVINIIDSLSNTIHSIKEYGIKNWFESCITNNYNTINPFGIELWL